MPGSNHGPSIKNPRVYDALRRDGMSKARAARISNAMAGRKRRRAKAAGTSPTVIPPTGPGGLVAAPGLEGAISSTTTSRRATLLDRRRRRTKEGDSEWDEGRVSRADDGKFASSPGGGGADEAPKEQPKKESAAERSAKRIADAEAQATRREEERAALAAEKDPKKKAQLRAEFAKRRAAERMATLREREAARVAREEAAEARSAAREADREKKAGERKKKAEERKAAIAQKRAEREAAKKKKADAQAAKKPKAGGGKKQPAEEPKKAPGKAPGKAPAQVKRPTAGGRIGGGGGPSGGAVARAIAEGTRRQADQARDAALEAATPAERRRLQAQYRREALEARAAGKAYAPAPLTRRERRLLRRVAVRRPPPRMGRLISLGLVAETATGFRLTERGRALLEQGQKALTVTKDATGRYRWVMRTTTAYRDRDGEILSEAALTRDTERMTATGQYGPLRYWHMGAPNAKSAEAPWGPGLDLGMCDRSYQIGRTRIESGTFYHEQVGAALAKAAGRYETSPGFFHPPGQPGPGQVFEDIHTFERSIVPVRLARASNLFTGMAVGKEQKAMTPEEFQRRAKAFMEDLRGLGLDQETIMETLQAAQKAEQTADRTGIAYKAQTVYQLPDGTPAVIDGGQIVPLVAYKAPMPGAEMIEAGTTEAMDGMAEEEAEGDEGAEDEEMILGPTDVAAIAQAVGTRIMEMLGEITMKMGQFEEELKARGYARMKAAEDGVAALAPRMARIEAALETIVGDLPAVRPSQSATTAAPADDPIVAAGAANARAKAAQEPPRTLEEAIARSLPDQIGARGFTGPWPFDVTPPAGVDPARHGGAQD